MRRYSPHFDAYKLSQWMEPEEKGDYVEYEEAAAIIAEQGKEIERLNKWATDVTTLNHAEFNKLQEQLRASNEALEISERRLGCECTTNRISNEALVAAQARIIELKQALSDSGHDDETCPYPRHPCNCEMQVLRKDNLTALVDRDKEVRAKVLDEASDICYDAACHGAANELNRMAAELRTKS